MAESNNEGKLIINITEISDKEELIKRISEAIKQGTTNEERPIDRIARKLQQWIMFSVIAALLPIAINWFKAGGDGASLSFTSLISHGELVLVCAAITAEAIGDIFVSGKTKGSWNIVSFGTCCLVFFLSSALFVIAEGNPHGSAFIASSSLWIFIFTILAGGSCKILAEV